MNSAISLGNLNELVLVKQLRTLIAQQVQSSTLIEPLIGLGYVFKTTSSRDINEKAYSECLDAIPMILGRWDKYNLTVHIFCVKVIQNLVESLFSRNFYGQITTAFNILSQQFSNFCSDQATSQRKRPISFLIAIIDAYYRFASLKIQDEGNVIIDSLVTLNQIRTQLTTGQRQSITNALRFCMDKLVTVYTPRAGTVDELEKLCQSLSIPLRALQDSRASVMPRKKRTHQDRIAIQAELKAMPLEKLIDLVVFNMWKFKAPDGFTIPATTDMIIKNIVVEMHAQHESPREVAIETAKCLVANSLRDLNKEKQFMTLKDRSKMIALMVYTIDAPDPNFDTADSVLTAVVFEQCATDIRLYEKFLSYWAQFEYCKQSPTRYSSLVHRIMLLIAGSLGAQDKVEDNPFLNFLTSLIYISQEDLQWIADLCRRYSSATQCILYALFEFTHDRPLMKEQALDVTLSLVTSTEKEIRNPAIGIAIEHYFIGGFGQEKMTELAISNFRSAVTQENQENLKALTKFFFTLIRHDGHMLYSLMEIYGDTNALTHPKETRSMIVLKIRKIKIQNIPITTTIIRELLDLGTTVSGCTRFLHLILLELSSQNLITTDDAVLVKEKFDQTHNAYLLLPILNFLSPHQYLNCFDYILEINEKKAIESATISYIKNKVIGLDRFATYLMRMSPDSVRFENAKVSIQKLIDSFMELEDAVYAPFFTGMNTVLKDKPPSRLLVFTCRALLKARANFWGRIKEILRQSFYSEIYNDEDSWEQLKFIISDRKPESFELLHSLPVQKVLDFIDSHPELTDLIRNTLNNELKKKGSNSTFVNRNVLHITEILNAINAKHGEA